MLLTVDDWERVDARGKFRLAKGRPIVGIDLGRRAGMVGGGRDLEEWPHGGAGGRAGAPRSGGTRAAG